MTGTPDSGQTYKSYGSFLGDVTNLSSWLVARNVVLCAWHAAARSAGPLGDLRRTDVCGHIDRGPTSLKWRLRDPADALRLQAPAQTMGISRALLLADDAVLRRTREGHRELVSDSFRLSPSERRFLGAVTGHTPLRVLLDLGLLHPA